MAVGETFAHKISETLGHLIHVPANWFNVLSRIFAVWSCLYNRSKRQCM